MSENMPGREPVELRTATLGEVDFTERVIQLIAVPYNEETLVAYRDKMIRESVEPGAFDGIETRSTHVTVNRDHDYSRTVGKATSYQTADQRGLVTDLYISDTDLGTETLRLAADGVLKASVGMVVRRSDQTIRNGLRRIHRAFLDHVALVPNPAYQGAGVLAVRQGSERTEEAVDEQPTPNIEAIAELAREADRIAAEIKGRQDS